MGWSREAVKNYKALNKIDAEAWAVIGTGFQNVVPDDEDEGVPSNGTGVPKSPFSENLLRNILDLAPSQQKQLCDLLAAAGCAANMRGRLSLRRLPPHPFLTPQGGCLPESRIFGQKSGYPGEA